MQIKLIQDMSELQKVLIYKASGQKQTSDYCLLKDFWNISFLARIYKTDV